MATTVKGGGIQVDGLAETLRALGKIDRRFKAEAIDTMRDGAKMVQKAAQGRIGTGGYRLKRLPKGGIGRSVTGTGAGIKLRASKYPWAYQAEFGEKTANIPIYRGTGRRGGTRRKPQSVFDRATAPKFKPPTSKDFAKNKGGYMIQPMIRKFLPVLREEAGERITALVTKAMRSQGVKSR